MLISASVIALLILAPDIWPYFKTSDETPAETKAEKREIVKTDFSVLHFNVKEKNKNILSVAETALASDADMVSMQELHASSLAEIDTVLRKKYPYVLSDVSIKGFGMAVYSKYPIDSGEAKKQNDYIFLTGYVKMQNRMVRFVSATTSTPTNGKDYSVQIKQFKFLTDYINTVDSALIVMGDMNSVPWSEPIKTFMEHTHLADSRKDLSATYPAQSPLQIPIDYIFHSSELDCKKFTTVGGSTSNHLGIIGFYNFRDTEKKDKLHFKDMVN
jgi:endonuclease/exonuclease/phosphatase (EEP) superfamily protein YafD